MTVTPESTITDPVRTDRIPTGVRYLPTRAGVWDTLRPGGGLPESFIASVDRCDPALWAMAVMSFEMERRPRLALVEGGAR